MQNIEELLTDNFFLSTTPVLHQLSMIKKKVMQTRRAQVESLEGLGLSHLTFKPSFNYIHQVLSPNRAHNLTSLPSSMPFTRRRLAARLYSLSYDILGSAMPG